MVCNKIFLLTKNCKLLHIERGLLPVPSRCSISDSKSKPRHVVFWGNDRTFTAGDLVLPLPLVYCTSPYTDLPPPGPAAPVLTPQTHSNVFNLDLTVQGPPDMFKLANYEAYIGRGVGGA